MNCEGMSTLVGRNHNSRQSMQRSQKENQQIKGISSAQPN